MLSSDSRVDRSASVSSMRSTNVPSLPCASSQLKSAVRALPTCSCPVGLGANLTSHASVVSRQVAQSSVAVVSRIVSRQQRVSRATACAAIASPRPTASTPSFVFAFTLTRLASMPSAAARRDSMASRCGPIFGRSRITTTSTFSTASPRPRTSADALPQQRHARRALPSRIGIRIVLADVAGPRRAEDRVGHGMTDDVGIGVSERPAFRRHGHAAEHERPALDQPVQIVADAHASCGARRRLARGRARGRGRRRS